MRLINGTAVALAWLLVASEGGLAIADGAKAMPEVTLQTAQGGAELVTPVMTGQREFGFSNISSLLIAQTRGLDIVAVGAGASSTGEAGRVKKKITTIIDTGRTPENYFSLSPISEQQNGVLQYWREE